MFTQSFEKIAGVFSDTAKKLAKDLKLSKTKLKDLRGSLAEDLRHARAKGAGRDYVSAGVEGKNKHLYIVKSKKTIPKRGTYKGEVLIKDYGKKKRWL